VEEVLRRQLLGLWRGNNKRHILSIPRIRRHVRLLYVMRQSLWMLCVGSQRSMLLRLRRRRLLMWQHTRLCRHVHAHRSKLTRNTGAAIRLLLLVLRVRARHGLVLHVRHRGKTELLVAIRGNERLLVHLLLVLPMLTVVAVGTMVLVAVIVAVVATSPGSAAAATVMTSVVVMRVVPVMPIAASTTGGPLGDAEAAARHVGHALPCACPGASPPSRQMTVIHLAGLGNVFASPGSLQSRWNSKRQAFRFLGVCCLRGRSVSQRAGEESRGWRKRDGAIGCDGVS
jgi:hypothetical protein